ncbi:MAG: hypothetical protein ACRDGA_14565, partial [Bacteroidota bacterium]
MKTILICLTIVLAVVAATTTVTAQEVPTILCTVCKQPNNPDNNFCTSCGAQLADQKPELQETKTPFTYREPSKLFSVPTAAVLPELALGFTLGNSFGQQEFQSFLGNVSAGIGDIAELELNTSGMVGNIIAGTTRMSSWAMKVQVYSGDERWPAAALSLRSSNDWDEARFNAEAVQTGNSDQYRAGLRGLDYGMRLTTVTLSLSQRIYERTTVHGTVGFSDIRHRNVRVWRVADMLYDPLV